MRSGRLWGHQDYIASLANQYFSSQFLSDIAIYKLKVHYNLTVELLRKLSNCILLFTFDYFSFQEGFVTVLINDTVAYNHHCTKKA